VPKRVDHEERRRQIADALLRAAAARGLHATGMREVAAEAGVSLRLVQYYFGTKEELLLAGMQHLAARFGEGAMTRIKRIKKTGGQASPRDVIAAILAEALPADDERRTFAVLNAAYFALSLTDPALAIAPLVKNSDAVIDVVAAQLRAAQAAGDTPAHLNPDAEALGLLAMAHGLSLSVLSGQSSAEQAQAVIDYHLARLFPVSGPALRLAADSAVGAHVGRGGARAGLVVPPLRGKHHAGRDQLKAVKRQPREHVGVPPLSRQARLLEAVLRGGRACIVLRRDVGGDEVASRRQGVEQGREELGGLLLVGDHVQDRDEHERDRLGEVEDIAGHRVVQDSGGVAQVGVDIGGAALR
jgi:AcrR family transcriptional regulator